MNQPLPPLPNLVPETAPFTEEQRSWLNGFFAGLVSLDSAGSTPLTPEQNAALMRRACRQRAAGRWRRWRGALARPDHCRCADRMKLAEGRPLRRRMMAAMAQQDCGQCGYSCEDYSNKIFLKEEERLNLCVPGGKETARMLKSCMRNSVRCPRRRLRRKPPAADAAAAPAAEPGRSRDNPAVATFLSRARLNKGNSEKETWHLDFDLERMRSRLCARRFLRALSGERSGSRRCGHRVLFSTTPEHPVVAAAHCAKC